MGIIMIIAVITGGINPGHNRTNIFNYLHFQLRNCRFKIEELILPEISTLRLLKYEGLIVFTSLESATHHQLDLLRTFSMQQKRPAIYFHESAIYDPFYNKFVDFLGVRFGYHLPYGLLSVKTNETDFCKNVATDFEVKDECYYFNQNRLGPMDKILITGPQGTPLGYLRKAVWGELIYMALGHNEECLSTTEFQTILKNCVKYLFRP